MDELKTSKSLGEEILIDGTAMSFSRLMLSCEEFEPGSTIVAVMDLVPLAPVKVSPEKEKLEPSQVVERVPLTSPLKVTVAPASLQVPDIASEV